MKQKFKFYFLWLMLINIFVFILQNLISGFTDAGVLNPSALHGQYWRFLTAIFLHGSIVHLLYNILALFIFGIILEKTTGSNKFLLIYFTSGIFANIVSVNFYESSLGASGAIYGIMGCLTILRPFMMVWTLGAIMPMFIAAILWTIGGIIGIFIPSATGHIAHLSGLAAGFLFGLINRRFRFNLPWKNKEKRLHIPESYMQVWESRYMEK